MGNNATGVSISEMAVKNGKLIFRSGSDIGDGIHLDNNQIYRIRLEVDLEGTEPYLNFYLDDQWIAESPIDKETVRQVNYFEVMDASGEIGRASCRDRDEKSTG